MVIELINWKRAWGKRNGSCNRMKHLEGMKLDDGYCNLFCLKFFDFLGWSVERNDKFPN